MKIKPGMMLQAAELAAKMIEEGRAIGQKGKYRISRLPEQLAPEIRPLEARRTELIKKHGSEMISRVVDGKEVKRAKVVGEVSVPGEKWDPAGWAVPTNTPEFEAFMKEWIPICEDEIDIAIEPIPLSYLEHFEPKYMHPDETPKRPISEAEFQILGVLVRDDSST